MCGHEEGEAHGRGRRGFRRHGFGRHGFPDRAHLLERLQGYREHLESELANVQDLIGRLGDEPEAPAQA
jgi:hypothetical protein